MDLVHKVGNNSPVNKQVDDLVARFDGMKQRLSESMGSVKEINSEEIEVGFLKGLRGKTDAQIAKQVNALGKNLLETQLVVEFLIELNHAKNEVLRGFFDALVRKLVELDNESQTIVGDQDVSKANERKIVLKIKEQIEARLNMESKIENNRVEIGANREEIEANKELIEGNREQVSDNSQAIDSNRSSITNNSSSIVENKQNISSNSQSISDNKSSLEGVKQQLHELTRECASQHVLQDGLQRQLDKLEARVQALESSTATNSALLSLRKQTLLTALLALLALTLTGLSIGGVV